MTLRTQSTMLFRRTLASFGYAAQTFVATPRKNLTRMQCFLNSLSFGPEEIVPTSEGGDSHTSAANFNEYVA